jgi:hypothetical protein
MSYFRSHNPQIYKLVEKQIAQQWKKRLEDDGE